MGTAKSSTLRTRGNGSSNGKGNGKNANARSRAKPEPEVEQEEDQEVETAGADEDEEVEDLGTIGEEEEEGGAAEEADGVVAAADAEEPPPEQPTTERTKRGRKPGTRNKTKGTSADDGVKDLFAELCDAGFTIKRIAASHGKTPEQILSAVGTIVQTAADLEVPTT